MRSRSPLHYDVSVAADKARRQRRRGMSGIFAPAERPCEWPGCEGAGQYRAPHSPRRLNDYRWFCLEHVRRYNAEWNFFAEMSDEEFEAQLSADRVWERPTWALGSGPSAWVAGVHPHTEGRAWARFGFRDPREVLGEAATLNPSGVNGGHMRRRPLSGAERRALDWLGLPHDVEARSEVRARYRALILELHPDMNGGRNLEPERLARVIRAWQVLRTSPNFAD